MNTMDKAIYPGTVKSALAACRRVLKAAGWPMGKTLGRYSPWGDGQKYVEGIRIHRIGVSSTVSLSWLDSSPAHGSAATYNAKIREARDLLIAKGFPFDERGWMECRYE